MWITETTRQPPVSSCHAGRWLGTSSAPISDCGWSSAVCHPLGRGSCSHGAQSSGCQRHWWCVSATSTGAWGGARYLCGFPHAALVASSARGVPAWRWLRSGPSNKGRRHPGCGSISTSRWLDLATEPWRNALSWRAHTVAADRRQRPLFRGISARAVSRHQQLLGGRSVRLDIHESWPVLSRGIGVCLARGDFGSAGRAMAAAVLSPGHCVGLASSLPQLLTTVPSRESQPSYDCGALRHGDWSSETAVCSLAASVGEEASRSCSRKR